MTLPMLRFFARSAALCLLILTASLTFMVKAEPFKDEHIEVELVSEVESIQAGQPFWVALRMKTEAHWHTYWLNPGGPGLPTSLKWKLPAGFTAGPIQWPFPTKIVTEGLVSYGYEEETFLLVRIQPPATLKPGTKIELAATADWLVCKEICLPGHADLKLGLTVADGVAKPSTWSEAFSATRAKLPLEGADWKLQAAIQNDKILLKATQPADFKDQLKQIVFLPQEGLIIEDDAPQPVKRVENGYLIELKRSMIDPSKVPSKLEGILISEGWRGEKSERSLRVNVEIGPMAALGNLAAVTETAKPDVAGTKPGAPASFLTILIAIGSAFIGGLILNLMPCVLPVLSIKVLSFVQQAGEDKSKVWKHGAVFTLGVLTLFWGLAGSLLILRAGGEQIGWGFQLQSPGFLIFICSLLFLLGLNLFGVFEIVLNVGGNLSSQSGYSGSFFSGALATLVATPCTAPFMGSALGFAIAQPPIVSMLIFTSLGLGMAFPYLMLSLFPALMRFVPRPGVWMEAFKQFMGFLMMATVVWLAWVFGLQVGVNGLIALMGGFVVMGIGAWVLGRWGNLMMASRTRLIAHVVAGVLIAGGIGLVWTNSRDLAPSASASTQSTTTAEGITWEAFTPERFAEVRATGKPVFIDFTAAWCLSCQVNEKVALSKPEIAAEFKKRGIVTMKADWTSRNEAITRKLAEFGRNGVPLYVLYTKDQNQPPMVLPEVITPSIVMDALQKVN